MTLPSWRWRHLPDRLPTLSARAGEVCMMAAPTRGHTSSRTARVGPADTFRRVIRCSGARVALGAPALPADALRAVAGRPALAARGSLSSLLSIRSCCGVGASHSLLLSGRRLAGCQSRRRGRRRRRGSAFAELCCSAGGLRCWGRACSRVGCGVTRPVLYGGICSRRALLSVCPGSAGLLPGRCGVGLPISLLVLGPALLERSGVHGLRLAAFRLRFRRDILAVEGDRILLRRRDRVGSGIRSTRRSSALAEPDRRRGFRLLEASLGVVDGLPPPLGTLNHAGRRLATVEHKNSNPSKGGDES